MDNSVLIFINKNAVNLDELFLNEEWSLTKIYDRIYSISIENHKLNWLVKTYTKKIYAKKESKNLNILQQVVGVPKLLAVNLSSKLNYIILSQAPGIDLYEYTVKHGLFSEKKLKLIAKQLLTIVRDIHKLDVIHQDIKPENIVYDKKTEQITLIDFEEKFTTDYRSPEQVLERNKSPKIDIWSCGITFYFLLTGDVPFHNSDEILSASLTTEDKWSLELQDFLQCLIERNHNLRYNAKEALEHIWITS